MHRKRNFRKWPALYWLNLSIFLGIGLPSSPPTPAAEELLPQDTLLMVTAPDFRRIREIFKASPESQLWNDSAMRPFKEKFLSRWSEEFIKPLEHELGLHFDDYTSLMQGQVTFALIQPRATAKEDEPMGRLLIVDTREKSDQLKTNLFELRKNWVDAGRIIKTEKICGFDFMVLPVSSNEVPRTFQKFFPRAPQVQEMESEDESHKTPTRSEMVIGQAYSLLIMANSLNAVEKIAPHLAGGSMPSLGELPAYDADHQRMFRGVPLYGWCNVKALVELMARQASEKKDTESGDPFGNVSPTKIASAVGLAGVKTVAFNLEVSNEGRLFQLFIGVPEAGRQGIFKLLSGEGRDSRPPPFVPAAAGKFQRWRIDGQKAWVTLERMFGEISPQWLGGLNSVLEMANNMAKEKDPGFDIKQNFIGNLGDDLIIYEKAPRGTLPSALLSPPVLYLIGSPNPERLVAALKIILTFLNQQGSAPAEREFLGHKIFSLPAPALPWPRENPPRPSPPRTLHCTAGGGYVAMSTDTAMLEEFLRSSSSESKTLRQITGLAEAAQRVVGQGAIWFGYQNRFERMRTTLELLKRDPGSVTNSSMNLFPVLFGLANPEPAFRGLMDFSLLPAFDRLAKYFHFSVSGGSATVEGLSFKWFAPAPPQLRKQEE